VAFHPHDHRLLASAGADGKARLWDVTSGQQLRGLPHAGSVGALTFSSDGRRLAVAAPKAVKVWDTTTWQEIPPSPLATQGDLVGVAFSPDGRLLAAGGYGGHPATVWDAATGKLLRELPNRWMVWSVAFSPDGKRIASANADGTVRVWDVTTGQEVVRPPLRHAGPARGVAFSPDGQRLASGGLDQTVKVWDTTTWRPRLLLRDPTGGVLSVAFSPDGRRLAWGSSDGTVKVWDDAGEEVHTLRGHTGWVNGVAFSPDGRHIASASADGTVRIWQAPPVAEQPGREARDQGQ
jgi:WD40 repeat protein